MAQELTLMNFSGGERTSIDTIVAKQVELAAYALNKHYPSLIGKPEYEGNYSVDNETNKQLQLKFASDIMGYASTEPTMSLRDLQVRLDSNTFRDILHSITVETIRGLMAKYQNEQIGLIASTVTVTGGNSHSFEIDTKALPTFQRGSYSSNVTLVPTHAKKAITITPQVYTAGISLEYARLGEQGYDWAWDVAKVYAGMLFAQYKLVYGKVFSETVLSTPLYLSSYTNDTYVQLAADIGMLNGSGAGNTLAMGTLPALNKLTATATSGGFFTKDDYIKSGYLKEVAGVLSTPVENFTQFNKPFNATNASALRTIPDNLVVMVSRGVDPVVKLVKSDYIRAKEVAAQDNTYNRYEYAYTCAFDAAIATPSFFGVVKVA